MTPSLMINQMIALWSGLCWSYRQRSQGINCTRMLWHSWEFQRLKRQEKWWIHNGHNQSSNGTLCETISCLSWFCSCIVLAPDICCYAPCVVLLCPLLMQTVCFSLSQTMLTDMNAAPALVQILHSCGHGNGHAVYPYLLSVLQWSLIKT